MVGKDAMHRYSLLMDANFNKDKDDVYWPYLYFKYLHTIRFTNIFVAVVYTNGHYKLHCK